MPTMLEDYAGRVAAGARDFADQVRHSAQTASDPTSVARSATGLAIEQVERAKGVWKLVLTDLNREPIGEQANRLLTESMAAFSACRRALMAVSDLWGQIAQDNGGGFGNGRSPVWPDELAGGELTPELHAAAAECHGLMRVVSNAIVHRVEGFSPADWPSSEGEFHPDQSTDYLSLAAAKERVRRLRAKS